MRSHTIILLVTLFLSGLALLFMPSWTVDDAYIAYRYGKNLLYMGELNWNPGDAPVEGYTGVLLPILSLILHTFTDNIVPYIRLISLYCFLGSALTLYSLARRSNVSKNWSAGLVMLFCLSPMVYVHVFSGLETFIFAYLLLTVIFQVVRQMDRGWTWLGTMLLFPTLFLLSLCRPEGMIFSMLVLGLLLVWGRLGAWKMARGKLLTLTAILLAANAFYLYLKWDYYGSLLPNSYYAKAYHGFINTESIKEFLRFAGYYLVLPLIAALSLYMAGTNLTKTIDQKRWFIFGSTLIFLGIVLIGYSRSQLFMNYASRFFFPFFAPLLLILAILAHQGWRNIRDRVEENPLLMKRIRSLLIILAILQIGALGSKFISERQFVLNMDSIMQEEYLPAAEMLRTTLMPGSTIISYVDAGAISYHTNLRCVDFGRLNDAYLARQQPDSMEVLNYFFNQDAEAVIFTNLSPNRFDYLDEAFYIQRDPRFKKYQLVGSYGNSRGYPYYQFLYYRNDLLDSFY